MRLALCYPSSLPPTFACVAIASYWFHHHLQLPCDCAASWGGRIGGRQQLAHQGAKAETASTRPRGRGPDRRRAHQRQAVEEGEREEEEGASAFSLGAKVRNRKESLGLNKFASPVSNLGICAKWVSNDVRLLYWMSNFEIFHVAVVLLINGHYICTTAWGCGWTGAYGGTRASAWRILQAIRVRRHCTAGRCQGAAPRRPAGRIDRR